MNGLAQNATPSQQTLKKSVCFAKEKKRREKMKAN
jgi:hypothetical protein